ncbi:MAG TPA: 50S ribosomal protein L13 [Candidatus Paceibacterota bacterium]|nr:50S ribosomal protein L13 [Candidatus Paceibacterota bacterium]
MNHTVDATNQSLGRVATRAATLLMGKHQPLYARNILPTDRVTITNVSKLKLSPKKLLEKTYNSYSGYPGGLKTQSMEHIIATRGYQEIVARAVKGMLPDNRLRKDMLKHLTIIA